MKIQLFILSMLIYVSCSKTRDYQPDLILVNGKIVKYNRNAHGNDVLLDKIARSKEEKSNA